MRNQSFLGSIAEISVSARTVQYTSVWRMDLLIALAFRMAAKINQIRRCENPFNPSAFGPFDGAFNV